MKKQLLICALGSLLLSVLAPLQANAIATYENHKVSLSVYPEGAGKIYMRTIDWNESSKEFYVPSDSEYSDAEIVQYGAIETKDNKGVCHLYAKPNDGWEFVGFFYDDGFKNGSYEQYIDTPVQFANAGDGNPTSSFSSSPAYQVYMLTETDEYEGGSDANENKAKAEAAIEAARGSKSVEEYWAEQPVDNRYFAVFRPVGSYAPKSEDISVSDAGWATACLAYDAKKPEGVNTLFAKYENNEIVMNNTGGVIPAFTGFMIESTTGAQTVTFVEDIATFNDKFARLNNSLIGSLMGEYVSPAEGKVYILSKVGDTVGFYWDPTTNDEGASAYCAAGKAVLPVAGATSSSIVLRHGETTQIEDVTDVQENVCFDLMGRRVTMPESGIYIVNGKKMLVK